MFGGKRVTVSTEYKIMKHNDNLFAVMSYVTTKDHLGEVRTYTNFCGEAKSQKTADEMVMILKEAL